MMKISHLKIRTTSGKGSFIVVGGSRKIKMKYEGWVRGSAIARYDNCTINIKRTSVLKSGINIFKNGKKSGEIIYDSGIVTIKLKNGGKQPMCYALEYNKKCTSGKLILDIYDDRGVLQCSMIESESLNQFCNKLTRDYEVLIENYESKVNIEELLIYFGFAARYYLSVTDCNYFWTRELKTNEQISRNDSQN